MSETNQDFSAPRLFVEGDIALDTEIILNKGQRHYLTDVLRLDSSDTILVFNGRDGEWLARLKPLKRKETALVPEQQTRKQPVQPDLDYVFAPIKHARLDYMVQKAVEMGAGRLRPVMTRRTIVTRVNLERMRSNAIEAAEQCGILSFPEIMPEQTLEKFLSTFPKDRYLIFCDEAAPLEATKALHALPKKPVSVLIGPEGGFDAQEREYLLSLPMVHRLSLGPRILRADTASVAALTLVQSILGDWN